MTIRQILSDPKPTTFRPAWKVGDFVKMVEGSNTNIVQVLQIDKTKWTPDSAYTPYYIHNLHSNHKYWRDSYTMHKGTLCSKQDVQNYLISHL